MIDPKFFGATWELNVDGVIQIYVIATEEQSDTFCTLIRTTSKEIRDSGEMRFIGIRKIL